MASFLRSFLTPRTVGGWLRFVVRATVWAVCIGAAAGACVWAFFGSAGLAVYVVAVLCGLLVAGCAAPAVVFNLAHRVKVRRGEFGTSGPVQLRGSKEV